MRAFTAAQKQLLRSGSVVANLLATFYLDAGTYRFCDDVDNLYNGFDTYLGANSLAESVEITSGSDMAAERVTLRCDGQRMTQAGIPDPAAVLAQMMDYLHQQRRVDLALGLRYPDQAEINITIPIYAGKINHLMLVDPELSQDATSAEPGYLDIVLDSLAVRYGRAAFRTRSHQDQLEIDPEDNFYSFVQDAANTEYTLYWGKDAPYRSPSSLTVNFGGIYWSPAKGFSNSGR